MKNQNQLSEIQNRINELLNKLHQAQEQAPYEVRFEDDVEVFTKSVNVEDVWSKDELNEFVHLGELQDMLEDLEISK